MNWYQVQTCCKYGRGVFEVEAYCENEAIEVVLAESFAPPEESESAIIERNWTPWGVDKTDAEMCAMLRDTETEVVVTSVELLESDDYDDDTSAITFAEITRQLLAIGGVIVVDESEFSVYPEQICDSGSLLNMPVVLEGTGMLEGQCHRNTAALWLAGKLDAIGTGYCLSYSDWNNDGKQVLGWCRHSWGIVKGTILETTMTRDKYFGIVIDGDDADEFAEDEFDHEDECLDYATLFPLKRTA